MVLKKTHARAQSISLQTGFKVEYGGKFKAWVEDIPLKSVTALPLQDNQNISFLPSAMLSKLPEDNLDIFPNPTSGNLKITHLPDKVKINIQVLDITGNEVYHNSFSNQKEIIIDLSDIKDGVHLLKVEIPGKTILKKIIKIEED